MSIIELSGQEFDRLSKENPNITFYQTSSWGKLKAKTGWKSLFLAYKEDEEIMAIGLFLFRKMPLLKNYLVYSPRGYLMDFTDKELLKRFNSELIPYLKKKGAFQLVIDPYFMARERDIEGKEVEGGFNHTDTVDELIRIGYRHRGWNLHYENLQPRWLFRLDITKPYSELEKAFRYEAKRRSRKKDFLGIRVRELNREEVPVFKSLMESTAKRRGFLDRSLSYYEQMYSALHDDGILRYMVAELDCDRCRSNVCKEIETISARIEKLKLHEEKNKGRIKEDEVTLNSMNRLLEKLDQCEKELGKMAPLSVVALLSRGKEAIMLLAGNNEDYLQHFNTSNIIVSELIKLCQSEGYEYYNFYGISGDFDPKNEDYGLYLYKMQYGGNVVELIGQFEYTINKVVKSLYDILLKAYSMTKR